MSGVDIRQTQELPSASGDGRTRVPGRTELAWVAGVERSERVLCRTELAWVAGVERSEPPETVTGRTLGTRVARPQQSTIIVVATIALLLIDSAIAANNVRRSVNEGLRQHRAGEFEAAAESFAAAAEADPEDLRLLFNQACSLAAQGKQDEAAPLFQQVSLAKDPRLAASAHYNLGCLAAAEAKALFGDKPEDAVGEARENGVRILAQAIAHYRDCLRVDDAHEPSRRNLEMLRLWIKHMQDLWAQRDRERRREEMDLLQFLAWIETEQAQLRRGSRALESTSDSPRRRQALSQAAEAQRLLGDEIEPLKGKIRDALTPRQESGQAGGVQQPTSPTPQVQAAIDALTEIASAARSSMSRAASDLVSRDATAAIDSQVAALDSLNEIYTAIAPFEHVLQKATEKQQQLVDVSQVIQESLSAGQLAIEALDKPGLIRDQDLVAQWAGELPVKAEHAIKRLGPPPAGPPPPGQDADAAPTQQEAQRAANDKAIELGPRIEDLASGAADHMRNTEWIEALPKQEEALRLLKEIAEQLPQDQQDNQQDQEQDKQDQQQDQQQQQQDQQQPKESNEKQEQQQDKQEQQKQQQQQQRKQMSREQREALLRKVRQREREHRERQKQLQRYLRGVVPVDRDW